MEARSAGREARSSAEVVSGAAAVGVADPDLDAHAAAMRISLFKMVVKPDEERGERYFGSLISIEKRD